MILVGINLLCSEMQWRGKCGRKNEGVMGAQEHDTCQRLVMVVEVTDSKSIVAVV